MPNAWTSLQNVYIWLNIQYQKISLGGQMIILGTIIMSSVISVRIKEIELQRLWYVTYALSECITRVYCSFTLLLLECMTEVFTAFLLPFTQFQQQSLNNVCATETIKRFGDFFTKFLNSQFATFCLFFLFSYIFSSFLSVYYNYFNRS